MFLFQNIVNNVTNLQEDFLGISINILGIGLVFLHSLICLSVFIVFYFFGEKVRVLFFKQNEKFNFFINIALGYIVIGGGLGLLGLFSLLNPIIFTGYLIVVCLIAFYNFPLKIFKKTNYKILAYHNFKKNFIAWAVILFVFITFLRLINPEIVEDGYHTDNAKLFITSHTTMHLSKDSLHTLPFPQLPEMIYMIPLSLSDKEATRYIHFGFYLLIIVLLFQFAKDKRYRFATFLPLLFVTTPVVIRNAPTQYTDFFALYTFLLAVFLIEKNMKRSNIVLTGILYGAVVSAKVWMLVYLPAVLLYFLVLNRHLLYKKMLLFSMLFLTGFLSVSIIWYVRAFLLTGNPIFPVMNRLFIKEIPPGINPIPYLTSDNYLGFNSGMFMYENLSGLSPLFFIGILSFIIVFYKNLFRFVKLPLFILLGVLTLEQLFIHIEWGRYLLIWFLLTSIFISAGILYLYKNNKLYKYGIILVFSVLFGYYFINTVLALPYGFGWANRNSYLTRILGRDNVSYYNFNNDFDKWISDKDLVATYGIYSFYYADFKHVDVGYILKGKSDSFDNLKKNGVTKLLIKGGEIDWFCKELSLYDCNSEKVKQLAFYPDYKKYNLYLLK